MSQPIRVLHVDDEPDLADLAAEYIEREDQRFSFRTATDAGEALEMISEDEYHCIVSDYEMPGRNGIEFLEAVRQEFPNLPFILFTGKGSEEVASDAISAGVTDYIQKQTGTSQYTVLANRINNAVDQYRSGQILEETERKLSQLAEKTDDVLFMFDSDWSELLYINSAYEEVWGRSIDELEQNPRSFLENIHPDDEELIEDTFERILDGKPTAVEYRILTDGGNQRWLYSEGKPIYDEDGTFARIVGVVRDITEQKQREEQLHREGNRFRAVFEESFDAMVLADDDGRYIDANQSAAELFGLPMEELLGRSIDDFAPDEFDFEDAWREFQQSENERGTFPLVRPDGTKRIVEYAASANIVSGEHLSVLRDVTERENRRKTLESQNERLEEFTSIVSHDLRNPFAVAQGRLELARDDCDSGHLDAVARAQDRMAVLIDDLLSLAREGDSALDISSIDLEALIEDCWQSIETEYAYLAKEVERTIRADESRLRQLLENLIRNAVEHGGSDVTVTVGEIEDGFFVEDDGPGIPEDRRDEVYEAGYSTIDDGTGFGLSIVNQVADAHNWEVSVTEGTEGGARFEVKDVAFAAE